MKDVFEVQDEIARNIAEALRITLSPQEQDHSGSAFLLGPFGDG
jgi:hypothetical protein